jgi:AAA+ ATPase superfamily predicted ATPase
MTKLVDRTGECQRLRQAADEPPQLIVMRGRQRVGKSFLANRAFDRHRLLYFQADAQEEAGHLQLLAREAATLLPGDPPLRFDDWDAVLHFLGKQASASPLVVVLDEFQWLWDAQPALDSVIQRHWDVWDREQVPVTLLLSGSSLMHMQRLLEPGRPLYGRANYRPLLLPLDYRWSAEFAASEDPEELLRRYAVLGGTPQYQVWAGQDPIMTVIAERILSKGESLYEEPLHLLREEQTIRTPGTYFEVLRAIASGASQYNDIAQKAGVEVSNLKRMLDRLIELGYVELHQPLQAKGSVAKQGVYRLADPFFRFWFRYVFPNRSRLERGRVKDVLQLIKADLDNYMGLAFEDCCRAWVGRYASGLPELAEIGSWWSRKGDIEIDIVGVNKQRYALVGSCKWHRKAPSQVLGELKRDMERLGFEAGSSQTIVFARGFDPKLVERAEAESALLVSAADLFGDR